MTDPHLIAVTAAFWQGDCYREIALQIPVPARIAEVLRGLCAQVPTLSYEQLVQGRVGIFNRLKTPDAEVTAGDRIECYCPLRVDPKEARLRRLQKAKRAAAHSRRAPAV